MGRLDNCDGVVRIIPATELPTRWFWRETGVGDRERWLTCFYVSESQRVWFEDVITEKTCCLLSQ